MMDLFKHVGKVQDEDTYEAAMDKIRKALRGRGNRTAAVFEAFHWNTPRSEDLRLLAQESLRGSKAGGLGWVRF